MKFYQFYDFANQQMTLPKLTRFNKQTKKWLECHFSLKFSQFYVTYMFLNSLKT